MKSVLWVRRALALWIAVMMVTPSLSLISLADDDMNDDVDDVLEDIADELDDASEDLQDEVEDMLDDLADLEDDDKVRELERIKVRVRAENVRREREDDDRPDDRSGRPEMDDRKGLWEIRWGVLNADRRNCAVGTDEEILAAIEAGDVVEGCETERVEYEGSIAVDRGKLEVRKEVLFEKNDQVLVDEGSMIEFTSVINGHWDGLIVQYEGDRPADDSAALSHSVLVASTDDSEVNDDSKYEDDVRSNDRPAPRPVPVKARANDRVDSDLRERLKEKRDGRMEMKDDRREDRPMDGTAPQDPVMVTIRIGELDTTLAARDMVGRHDIGNGHFIEIKPLVNVGSGVSEANQERVVQNKLRVQDKVTDVKEKVTRLRQLNRSAVRVNNLENVVDDIGEYNFDDTSAAEIQAELQAILDELGDDATAEEILAATEELRQKAARIKELARDRKFRQQLIPFKDTDDDQWYTNYVSGVKQRGIISGYKDENGNDLGEYRPGRDVTVGEIFKIGLEASGEGQANASDGAPRARVAQEHWARLYVKRAEELGLDLSENLDDLNRPATRAEVIRFMLEAMGIDPGTCASVDFTDVPRTHEHACFIQYAKELGIISGDDGSNTFRPDEPINRAETAKIADEMIDTLLDQ